nr:MAG TPA: hypothetical protein [Caudoviricetes sp.]
MVVVSPSTTVSMYPSARVSRLLDLVLAAVLSSVAPSDGRLCVPVSLRYGRSIGRAPPGFVSVHCRITSHASARQLRFSNRYFCVLVWFAPVPNVPSWTRYRSSSMPNMLMTGTLTSCQLDVRTPNAPARIGVPKEDGSSIGERQNSASPRLYGWSAAALAAGVAPGISVHGSSRPLMESSPRPLSLVVVNEQSETVMDQEKLGMSISWASCPVWTS